MLGQIQVSVPLFYREIFAFMIILLFFCLANEQYNSSVNQDNSKFLMISDSKMLEGKKSIWRRIKIP